MAHNELPLQLSDLLESPEAYDEAVGFLTRLETAARDNIDETNPRVLAALFRADDQFGKLPSTLCALPNSAISKQKGGPCEMRRSSAPTGSRQRESPK